ncbi:MAG: hypothetical protein MUF75_02855 [Bacteroidia bacterium]|jgi:hypothetical protein|nr:hypothetical protein [Bacteroidia bacterium]
MILRKTTLLFVFLMLSLLLGAQKKRVTLELLFTEPYCGGARPSPEILEEAQKQKPFAGRKMILISKTGKVDTLLTDAKGKIVVKLNKGEYTVFEPWRYYKSTFSGAPGNQFDQACLKAEWEKPTLEIKVTRKKASIMFKNELQNYCDWATPCLLEIHAPPMRE